MGSLRAGVDGRGRHVGGLGILAGDILKEASDLALPLVGLGLMYRTGYFHQRIDVTGYQYEYWLDADPERLPCVPCAHSALRRRFTT